jgi:beta-lactam-binding protein with PASTA domain
MVEGSTLPALENYSEQNAANDTIIGVPYVIGMGLRDAIYALESKGYTVSSSGHGRVISQEPLAGALADSDKQAVTIVLKD